MLAYIKGEFVEKQTGYIVVDVNGLGYKIFMSDFGIENLGNIGDIVKVYTYYKVSEDDISIYGFRTKEELRMFELLISVSGIGAKTALTMLGSIEPSQFAIAVISNDTNTLKTIPGVGQKSAQRIVLELKDKLKKEQQISELRNVELEQQTKVKQIIVNDEKVEEAISAFQVLGYQRKDIDKIISKMDITNLSLEEIIKQGLRLLSK